MNDDSTKPLQPNIQLATLSDALGEFRDALVKLSLALTDLITETPSPGKEQVGADVARYLSHIRSGDAKRL